MQRHGAPAAVRNGCLRFPDPASIPPTVSFGFQTGDLVRTVVSLSAGRWTGRVLVRATRAFDISAQGRRVAQGISFTQRRILHGTENGRISKNVDA